MTGLGRRVVVPSGARLRGGSAGRRMTSVEGRPNHAVWRRLSRGDVVSLPHRVTDGGPQGAGVERLFHEPRNPENRGLER